MATVQRPERKAAITTIPGFYRSVNDRIRELGWSESSEYDLVCECDDADCSRELRMQGWEYDALRTATELFAVLPGHERAGRDELVIRTDRFLIVRMRGLI